MKTLIYKTLLLLLLSFTDKTKELKWIVLPIENSEQVFKQCSRECPRYNKIVVLENSTYLHAIELLVEKKKTFKEKIKINIEKYTIQLVGYRFKGKQYIYFNANSTELETNQEQTWTKYPIIWCDGSNSSWGMIYDVENKELTNFITNGPVITKIEKI